MDKINSDTSFQHQLFALNLFVLHYVSEVCLADFMSGNANEYIFCQILLLGHTHIRLQAILYILKVTRRYTLYVLSRGADQGAPGLKEWHEDMGGRSCLKDRGYLRDENDIELDSHTD